MTEDSTLNTPLVSIITPTYNRARYLDETICSVLGQDYRPIEYIVIDDGSTDDTCEVLAKHGDHISWWKHENVGETQTVNEGLRACSGDIVVVVNSDDPLLPGAIRRAVAELKRISELLAVYGDWVEIDSDSHPVRTIRLQEYDLKKMLASPSVALGPGTFFRRRALDLIGVRDTQFKYVGDLDYWFRLAAEGPLGYLPVSLATHRTHPDSLSSSERGRAMAAELVAVVHKSFANPRLPHGIRRLRRKAYSNIHFNAAIFCGQDRIPLIGHLLAAAACSPTLFVRRAHPHIIRRVLNLIPRPIFEMLRRGWHALGRGSTRKCRKESRKGDQ